MPALLGVRLLDRLILLNKAINHQGPTVSLHYFQIRSYLPDQQTYHHTSTSFRPPDYGNPYSATAHTKLTDAELIIGESNQENYNLAIPPIIFFGDIPHAHVRVGTGHI